jgi:putrescine:ornithine antiporter
VLSAAWNPKGLAISDAIAQSIPLTLWAFLGMESAAQASDAVEDPKRTVPLACLFGTLGAAVVYVLSTTVIQGIVPNAELANSSAPFAFVYAQMFNPLVGQIIMALAVMACVGSLLGWQFTLAQTAKMAADEGLFPKLFSKVSAMGAPIIGMLVCLVLQTLLALSTISPNASAMFSKLVNLAVVTNLLPYITALSGLLVIMYKAKLSAALYTRNVVALMVAMLYSYYALYASGKDAVFGGMMVLAIGYLLYGFIAKNFVDKQPVSGRA